MSLADLFRSVVSLSLLGSLLALGILFIQRLFRPKLSAHWHYALWFVLILRLLIPLTLPSSFSVLNPWPSLRQTFPLSQALSTQPFSSSPQKALTSTPPTTHTAQPEVGNLPSAGKTPVPSPTRATLGLDWLTAAFVWLGGVFLLFTYILVVNGWLLLKSKKQSLCEAPEVREILRECQLTLQVRSKVSVIYDDSLKSPALFGLIRPKIVISPKLLAELAPEEVRYIFLHELSHLKRRDHWVNAWVTLVQVVYWFNPLIGYALRHMKQDCEMACDATALAVVRPEEHRQYGQTIIRLLQLLSEPHWAPGTIGFANKFNKRRIIMIASFKKATLKWTVAALALTLVVGCSSLSNPIASTVNAPGQTANTTTHQNQSASNPSQQKSSTSATPATVGSGSGSNSANPSSTGTQPHDSSRALLSDMIQLARQGKVINCSFPAMTTNIAAVEQAWGQASETNYVPTAHGSYATFSSHKVVFGFNKGNQIFEVRSFDSRLTGITLDNVKQFLGTPAYNGEYNGQDIIGYTMGPEFKIEMVFPQPTAVNPDPAMDHYSVLDPKGTADEMGGYAGRQW
ncbi:regulatory protein BlaR1 [Peptococcaceae bacterium CEB3]|nr:regulatory protein BlaR1 [Peptococcaceae bacterium CEB3]